MAKTEKWWDIAVLVRECLAQEDCAKGFSDTWLKHAMRSAIERMAPHLQSHPHYLVRTTVTIPEGSRSLPLSSLGCVARIKKVHCPETCRDLIEGCPPQAPEPELDCCCKPIKPCCKTCEPQCGERGKPKFFERVGDEIWVSPTPDKDYSFEVTWCREPDLDPCTLVPDPENSGSTLVQWNEIDLPYGVFDVLTNLTLAFAFYKVPSKLALAQQFHATAENTFLGKVAALAEVNTPAPPKGTRMGRRETDLKRCCPPQFVSTPTVGPPPDVPPGCVRVCYDDDGNPIE